MSSDNVKTRPRVSEVTKQVEATLAKSLTSADDVWFKACDAAGLNLEQLVPIQSQRHLIASWAGVAAGVRFATTQLRAEIDRLTLDRDAKADTINSLQKQLQKRDESAFRAARETLGLKVTKILEDRRVETSVIGQISEEIATATVA